MRAPSVCLFVFVSAALCNVCKRGFHYTKSTSMFRSASGGECKLCYIGDCISVDQARCEYSMAISELQDTDEITLEDSEKPLNAKLKTEVDAMLFDVVEADSTSECIPFISQYTDCSKENTCLGCRTCTCNELREWTCSADDNCVSDKLLDVGQQELLVTSMILKNDNKEQKVKRSAINLGIKERKTEANNERELSAQMLSQWFYGVTLTSQNGELLESEANINTDFYGDVTTTMYANNDGPAIQGDYNYNEVEDNIAVGQLGYQAKNNDKNSKPVIKKPAQKDSHFDDYDVAKLFNEDFDRSFKIVKSNVEIPKHEENFMNFVNIMENDINVVDDMNEVYHNSPNVNTLLNPALEYIGRNKNMKLNIMKRDLTPAINLNATQNKDNVTNAINQLKNNVFHPINDIVNEKELELTHLKCVRDSLIQAMKMLNNDTFDNQPINKTQHNHTLFSIYKLEIVPRYETNYTRGNKKSHSVERHLNKLERDIYQVVRDVVHLQKHTDVNFLSPELKTMIQAMKDYFMKGEPNTKRINNTHYTRRLKENYDSVGDKTPKYSLTDILEKINNEMQSSDAFNSLTDKSKTVLYRIIKQYYLDEVAGTSLIDEENMYNFTNDFSDISTKWVEIGRKVVKSSPYDQLYNLKLLHLIMSVDINRMWRVLKLLDISQLTRKAGFQYDLMNQLKMYKMENNLKLTYDRYLKYRKQRFNLTPKVETTTMMLKKRKSFISRVKNILNTQYSDPAYLRRKIEYAKRKLHELKQLNMIKTIKKWQHDFQLRKKRSAYIANKRKESRIRSLPSYLRNKLTPAMNKKRNNPSQRYKSSIGAGRRRGVQMNYIKDKENKRPIHYKNTKATSSKYITTHRNTKATTTKTTTPFTTTTANHDLGAHTVDHVSTVQ